jgi:hypothetical protein
MIREWDVAAFGSMGGSPSHGGLALNARSAALHSIPQPIIDLGLDPSDRPVEQRYLRRELALGYLCIDRGSRKTRPPDDLWQAQRGKVRPVVLRRVVDCVVRLAFHAAILSESPSRGKSTIEKSLPFEIFLQRFARAFSEAVCAYHGPVGRA